MRPDDGGMRKTAKGRGIWFARKAAQGTGAGMPNGKDRTQPSKALSDEGRGAGDNSDGAEAASAGFPGGPRSFPAAVRAEVHSEDTP